MHNAKKVIDASLLLYWNQETKRGCLVGAGEDDCTKQGDGTWQHLPLDPRNGGDCGGLPTAGFTVMICMFSYRSQSAGGAVSVHSPHLL